MKTSSLHNKKIIIILLVLLAFFGLKFLPLKSTNWDYPNLLLLLFLVWNSISTNTLYAKLILGCSFFIFLSCLYSYFYNDQAFYLVVVHSYKYFSILFIFYLVKKNIPYQAAEKILVTIGAICCLCYTLQWLIYPVILFSGADSSTANEISYRVRIPGSISCYCLFFYGINKYLIKRKIKYLIYSIFGFFPILMMGFRSLLTFTLLFFFLLFPLVLRKFGKTLFYSLIGIFALLIVTQTDFVKSKIDEMNHRNEANQTFENENYIRWKELDYYWNEQFTRPAEKVFGGGVPTDLESKYANTIYGYAYDKRLFWDDLGLVGLSMIIGIPAVTLLVLLYLVCIWRCKEPELQYIRVTLAVVLLASLFTNSEVYRQGNLLLLTLFLYIEYKYHLEKAYRSRGIIKRKTKY